MLEFIINNTLYLIFNYSTNKSRGEIMLHYALVFFVISVIAGIFGFRGVESGASKIAKVFFFIFLALAVVAILTIVLGIKLLT